MKRIVLFVPLLFAALLLPTPAHAGVQAAATVTFVNAVTYDFGNDFELTVCVDGESVADDLSTGASTEPLAIAPGEHDIAYVQGTDCTDESPFVDETLIFDPAANLTVMAWWGSDDRGISVFENDISCVPSGQARLTLRNGSVVEPIDVVVTPDGGESSTVIEGVSTGEEGATEIAAGDYSAVDLSSEGTYELGPQTFEDGSSYVIYAYGGNDGSAGATFGPVLTDPCSTTTTTATTSTTAATAAAATVRPTFTG